MEAEAEQQAQDQAPRRGRSSGSSSPGGTFGDELSWEALFGLAAGDDGDDFSLDGWLAEGLRGLRGFMRSAGLNDEFWRHMRGAERELLLACRVLVDTRLERLERKPQAEESGRLQRIDIDFDE